MVRHELRRPRRRRLREGPRLDGELSPSDLAHIREHLIDCSPCLQQYDLDEALKALVRRSCRESAPAELRERIMLKITEVRIELQS